MPTCCSKPWNLIRPRISRPCRSSGNVGSVSAPITMALGIEQQALVPGQRAAILGIGSGINSLMLGIDW